MSRKVRALPELCVLVGDAGAVHSPARSESSWRGAATLQSDRDGKKFDSTKRSDCVQIPSCVWSE